MDRSMIAPYRAEEKELNEKLYKKLEGLMLIHQPNEELKRCFVVDMFLKSNQQAFFQVMHYLFRLHDAVEFKKRFYWPITDKRGESHFRSACVEYLKHLSEKHNLNWSIKSYLVQTPGGMKFITFLMDVVDFVVSEQVRLCKKQLNIEIPVEGFSELDLKLLQRKHEYCKDYAAEYITEIEEQTVNLRKKTQLIKAELNKIEEKHEIILDKHFLNAFQKSNQRHYEEEFLQQSQKIISFETPLIELKLNVEKFQQKATDLKKDKSILHETIKKILDTTTTDDALSMNSMIEAFVQIHPAMENWLQNILERNSFINNEGTLDLINLQTELEQTEAQIMECQKKFSTVSYSKGKDANRKELSLNCNLISKYVYTPPIKVNPSDNINQRLPLQGEATVINFLDLTHSARKTKLNANTSFDPNITLNRSKIIDPVNLLRTIYKDKSKKPRFTQIQSSANVSLLGLKWKERQQFRSTTEQEKSSSMKLGSNDSFNLSCYNSNDILISSPKTPFNANSGDITRIALSFLKNEGNSSSPMLLKSSVVKKVQDDALNIQNLSTSPTGRLEPLHPIDDIATTQCNNDDKFNVENNTNLLNVPKKLAFDMSLLDEDSIFNTSDTVLKDIA